MKLSDEKLYEILNIFIESDIFLIVFFAVFIVALFVYLYTGVLICRRKASKQGFHSCGINQLCYGGDNSENCLITSNGQYSPLNILKSVSRQCTLERLVWENHDALPSNLHLQNNGKTVVLQADFSRIKPKVKFAGLSNEYFFGQLSFRWGSNCTSGANHMLNGKKFPLEMQAMYHFGCDKSELSSQNILIIAFLFVCGEYNVQLQPIVQKLQKIRKPNSITTIPPVPLNAIVPTYNGGFFCYIGSMIEPPYNKGVRWFVYSNPISIAKSQLKEFHQLLGPNLKPIKQEVRPAHKPEK